jgi:DNA mismatch repair ATPase MutL
MTKEQRKEYNKKYYENNKKKLREHQREYREENKEQRKEYKKQWKKNNPEKVKKSHKKYNEKHKDEIKNKQLKQMYGITLKEKEQILINQNYKCAICKKDISGVDERGRSKACIDHDHNNVQPNFRGLLCWSCNNLLGLLENNKGGMRTRKWLNKFEIELDNYLKVI